LLHHCGSLSQIGGVERPGIVHRLDKETSGCLVVAKNDRAHRSLAEQFAGREVKKIYLAVTAGAPRYRAGTVEVPIARHRVHRQRMAVSEPGEGRDAVTDYRVISSANGRSLIECRPRTGRTHQIRVHLRHLGCPILGDPLYGRRGAFTRHMLHAWKLEFRHPITGGPLAFEAPPPEGFEA
jgi:23S rRNA pseudouridine1911/1915/1917 synthase